MKLEKYMVESEPPVDIMRRENDKDLDKMIKMVERDCQPFLKESQKMLYRGTKMAPATIRKVQARSNRRPKDMPIQVHNALDNIFLQEFGWKARSSGVFVATGANLASDFGDVSLFFPIGKYKYIWSTDISDLFVTLQTTKRSMIEGYQKGEGQKRKRVTAEEMTWLENFVIEHYKGENLNISLKRHHSNELMFYCPSGYYVASGLASAEMSYYLELKR